MSLGLSEIVLILIVVLILFGGKRIPELAKALGFSPRSRGVSLFESDFSLLLYLCIVFKNHRCPLGLVARADSLIIISQSRPSVNTFFELFLTVLETFCLKSEFFHSFPAFLPFSNHRTFEPFALSLKLHPSISAARRHISIRSRKISK